MSMAINRDEMVNSLYKGEASILNWPCGPVPEFSDIYTPVDKLPAEIRQLFEYHPDKARQLLADAGFSKGLTVQVTALKAYEDLMSFAKNIGQT